MNPTLPLVLLLHGDPALPEDRRTLARFSAQWSVEFAPVDASRVARAPQHQAYSALEPIALRIEELSNLARVALARLDEKEAREAIEAAERLLLDHPELPQAAWLRGEQLTISAELAEATGAPNALELRQLAAAMEGPRAAPFQTGGALTGATPAVSAMTISVTGLDSRDALEWDSVRVALPLRTVPGEHAVRVLRAGSLLWAGWVSVGSDTRTIALRVPAIAACGAEDLASVVVRSDRATVGAGVACPRWAVARRERGQLEVALCRRSECGRFHRLTAEPKRTPPVVFERPEASGFPTWATVAIATAGAVLTTSVVLWQTGTFDARTPARERWVYRGLE